MGYVTVFKRYEIKYLLDEKTLSRLMPLIKEHMAPDAYAKSSIRSLYFDTCDYRLVRRSVEKPIYKEKLRLRCYGTVGADDTVFAEIKKKYDHVVYKRRLPLAEADAMAWLTGRRPSPVNTQIAREIDYFLSFYGPLRPTVFLSYEREAFVSREDSGLRLTLDRKVLVETAALSLTHPPCGIPLLPGDKVLMEVKCGGGMPLWLTRALSAERIYKTSFSKYGTAYSRIILPNLRHDKKEIL